MEAGVVLDREGLPLYWHLPEGRTWGSLPDCRMLWDVLWQNRNRISGFAHSHPGRSTPGPSLEDVTTFAAIEAALGRRLHWWIASEDALVIVRWSGAGEEGYQARIVAGEPVWLPLLRAASRDSKFHGNGMTTKEAIHDSSQRGSSERHLGRAEW